MSALWEVARSYHIPTLMDYGLQKKKVGWSLGHTARGSLDDDVRSGVKGGKADGAVLLREEWLHFGGPRI